MNAINSNPNSEASYPAIKDVNCNFADYSTIIIAAPVWYAQMAAPMQTYLFKHGAEMAGKNIDLMVSSASSGISGVVSDAKRLVPGGNFFSENLWIRSYQTSNSKNMINNWLDKVGYYDIEASVAPGFQRQCAEHRLRRQQHYAWRQRSGTCSLRHDGEFGSFLKRQFGKHGQSLS